MRFHIKQPISNPSENKLSAMDRPELGYTHSTTPWRIGDNKFINILGKTHNNPAKLCTGNHKVITKPH